MGLITAIAGKLSGTVAVYLLLALLAVSAALALSVRVNLHQHAQAAAAQAQARGELDRASDANRSGLAAIALLRVSLAQCEAGRLIDESRQVQALADHGRQFAALDARYSTARAQLAAQFSGRCRDWAAQPACGVTP